MRNALARETLPAELEANLALMRTVRPAFLYLEGLCLSSPTEFTWILRWTDLESGVRAIALRTSSFERYSQVALAVLDERRLARERRRPVAEKQLRPARAKAGANGR